MRIKVTQKNIDEGCRGRAWYCPIARAFKDLGIKVAVADDVLIGKNYYILPDDVCDRITEYDKTGKMEPFEFDLPIDEPCST